MPFSPLSYLPLHRSFLSSSISTTSRFLLSFIFYTIFSSTLLYISSFFSLLPRFTSLLSSFSVPFSYSSLSSLFPFIFTHFFTYYLIYLLFLPSLLPPIPYLSTCFFSYSLSSSYSSSLFLLSFPFSFFLTTHFHSRLFRSLLLPTAFLPSHSSVNSSSAPFFVLILITYNSSAPLLSLYSFLLFSSS